MFEYQKNPPCCPVRDPIAKAKYDLIPRLIEMGFAGKYVALGYDVDAYAIGKNPDEAMQRLVFDNLENYQVPLWFFEVKKESLRSDCLVDYYDWKRGLKTLKKAIGEPIP